jgi:hypothetical protein
VTIRTRWIVSHKIDESSCRGGGSRESYGACKASSSSSQSYPRKCMGMQVSASGRDFLHGGEPLVAFPAEGVCEGRREELAGRRLTPRGTVTSLLFCLFHLATLASSSACSLAKSGTRLAVNFAPPPPPSEFTAMTALDPPKSPLAYSQAGIQERRRTAAAISGHRLNRCLPPGYKSCSKSTGPERNFEPNPPRIIGHSHRVTSDCSSDDEVRSP